MRGLADLNRDLLDGFNDPNLRTLIPHVPTLGATAQDVPEAAAVITGGNATHYWEESGIVGKLYEKTLGIDGIYAWDVWMVYRPGVRWDETYPPKLTRRTSYRAGQYAVARGTPSSCATLHHRSSTMRGHPVVPTLQAGHFRNLEAADARSLLAHKGGAPRRNS